MVRAPMRLSLFARVLVIAACACACGSSGTSRTSPDADVDAADLDAPAADAMIVVDADPNACAVSGAPGECMLTTACAALADHSSVAGHCAGPADIECCVVTPSTANNPPTPTGYKLMAQADVTAAMTTWAVMILNAPATYPMFSTTTMAFTPVSGTGTLVVLARVEWHPPDFQNGVIHRGVTLYEPI